MNAAASLFLRRSSLRRAAASQRSIVTTAVAAGAPTRTIAPSRAFLPAAARTAPTGGCSNSSGARFFSASVDALADILGREHAEENDSGTLAVPDELARLQKQIEADWKLVDDGAMTKLHRTTTLGGGGGANKVQISFHCQDTVDEYAGDDGEVEEDDDVEPQPSVRFTVTATRAGKSLVWDCVSRDAGVTIQGVGLTAEDVDLVQKTSGIAEHLYQGPAFTELAEDLQDAFHVYLEEELGVDADLATFIAMYADYREQVQYVKFLSDAREMVQSA